MSEWGAIQQGGEARTAWEYRIDFQQLGTIHKPFYCPFCGIILTPVLIFETGEISKSPHFAARSGDHLFDCDGEPVSPGPVNPQPPTAHYQKRMAHFPEALTVRPPARANHPPASNILGTPLTAAEVSKRRRHVGSLGKPELKSYVLCSVVEVYNAVLKEGYELAKDKQWNNDKKQQWIKDALSSMKLRLTKVTNYRDAFRTPSLIDGSDPRIYHSEGSIKIEQNEFVITSNQPGKIAQKQVPFLVAASAVAPSAGSPKSHQALINTLKDLVAAGDSFRWYAYGKPEQKPNGFVLHIDNLDYLYVKPVWTPKRAQNSSPE